MDMLGIVITLITFVIGLCVALGIFIYQKKYPCQILCSCIDTLNLSTPDKLGSSKISLLLNGEDVKKEVNYAKYLLVNDGIRDVESNIYKKEDQIEFRLPDSDRWVDFSVAKCSKDLQTKVKIDSNNSNIAILKLSRFRVHDAIILETVSDGIRDSQVRISHRLQNTRKIEVTNSPFLMSFEKAVFWLVKFFIGLVLLILVFNFFINSIPLPSNNVVRIDSTDNYVYSAELIGADSIKVYLESLNPRLPKSEILSYENFITNFKTYPNIARRHRNSYIVLGCTYFVILCYIVYVSISYLRERRRLKKNKKIFQQLQNGEL